MARKIQLGALILGMLLVGVERFTAQASAQTQAAPGTVAQPRSEGGPPIPPPM
jgi:hypothetical protein